MLADLEVEVFAEEKQSRVGQCPDNRCQPMSESGCTQKALDEGLLCYGFEFRDQLID